MTKDRFLAVSVGISEATFKQAYDNGVMDAMSVAMELGIIFTAEQLAALEEIKYVKNV